MPGKTVSRRLVMGVIGAGVVAAPLVAESGEPALLAPRRDDSLPRPFEAAPSSRAELLAPLVAGARFARWTVVSISPLELGSVTMIVKGEDKRQFKVEILRRDDAPLAPRPPAETDRFAIYVLNGGDGWLPTAEEQGLAAMTLAQFVEANEASVDAHGFLTHAERQARHASEMRHGNPERSVDRETL